MWGASGHKAYFVCRIYPLDICTQTWVLSPLLSWCIFTWKQALLFWGFLGHNVCDLLDLSSPTRDWTYALGSESMGSSPLDHQGIPEVIFVWFWFFFFLIPLIPLPWCRMNHNSGCFLPFQAPGPGSSSHGGIFFLADEPVSLSVIPFIFSYPSLITCLLWSSLNMGIMLYRASLEAQMVKNLACSVGDSGLIPGPGKSPEKGMAPYSSILAWRIPWTEESGRLQSIGSQSQIRLSDNTHNTFNL